MPKKDEPPPQCGEKEAQASNKSPRSFATRIHATRPPDVAQTLQLLLTLRQTGHVERRILWQLVNHRRIEVHDVRETAVIHDIFVANLERDNLR